MGRSGDPEMGTRRHGDGACGFAAHPCGMATPFRARPPKTLARLRLTRSASTCTILLAIITTSVAQQIGTPTTQHGVTLPRGIYAIRNAHIVTVSGPDIDNGTIVIRDGKIEAVGAGVSVPSGAQTIDARGLWVYPGMIDAATSMGLVEVGQGAPGTVDTAEVGDLNPNAKAIIAINPHSAHIAVTRVDGVTSAVSLPLGGLISGQAAIVNLVGTSPLEMAVVPYAALVINYPRAGGGGGGGGGFFIPDQPPNLTESLAQANRQLEQIRKMLRDAAAYGRAQEAYAKDNTLPRADQNIVLEPLVPYVRGERPVIFRAERETDIRSAIKFAEEFKLKPIILGGEDAGKIATFLKEKNVPVILTGILDLPSREDDFYDALYESAAKLQQAGVRFCISAGDSGANVRNLPFYAGMAAAFGLPKAEALKAVTLYPAQIMNVADRLGSIEVGKMANIVVTDGDLLETRTHVRHLFIDGRQIPLNSRHTDLNDAFKNRK
ncbi:MAG: amidohydrolase family protein [Pyrinomonadaceae bacterium]|nr:amidohydrolase family protein [Pyrinomonadaceae bacterium]